MTKPSSVFQVYVRRTRDDRSHVSAVRDVRSRVVSQRNVQRFAHMGQDRRADPALSCNWTHAGLSCWQDSRADESPEVDVLPERC